MSHILKVDYMRKLLVILLSSSFCFKSVIAQQTDSTNLSTPDTTETKKTTLTLAAIYSNNANYYGQIADEKIPYLALNATVRFPIGIYFSGLAYKLLNDSSIVSASTLGAGYEFNIVKKLTADVNYTHTFYPSNSPFLQASNPDILSATLNYSHIFTTGLTIDYAFGKDSSDYFVTLSNFKAFDFYTKDNKAIFSITPQVDITAGTQRFYTAYREKRNNKGKPTTPGPPPMITTSYQNFGMLSYNFKIPVSYSRASYMLEAAYQLSLLGKNAVTASGTANSFITISAYYQF